MLTDRLTSFGWPVDLDTSGTGTEVLGDAVDAGAASANLGVGIPFYLYLATSDEVTSGGAATVQFELVTADNEALTTNDEVVMTTTEFALADLGADTVLFVGAIPMRNYRRWIGLRQVTGAAALTGGSLYATMTQEPDQWRAYPEGMN